ncbi:hypothetical protein [Cellulomonas cellasea]|nr:hypothetical protein [Cellulomonas cellasea]
MSGGTPTPASEPVLAGLALVPLGDEDAGTCVDGVCVIPGAAEPGTPRT